MMNYLIIMQTIIEQVPINLSRLMMNYTWEEATRKHSSLPYGMILILIFREFRIPISIEEPKRLLWHIDTYNLATLKRMGFQKVNDVWIRKSKQFENIEINEDLRHTEEEIPKASSPVPPPAP